MLIFSVLACHSRICKKYLVFPHLEGLEVRSAPAKIVLLTYYVTEPSSSAPQTAASYGPRPLQRITGDPSFKMGTLTLNRVLLMAGSILRGRSSDRNFKRYCTGVCDRYVRVLVSLQPPDLYFDGRCLNRRSTQHRKLLAEAFAPWRQLLPPRAVLQGLDGIGQVCAFNLRSTNISKNHEFLIIGP